jgi:hypothetical protein
MRHAIAIVGSYGSGRSTLTRALAERCRLPITYGSAMADPIGAEGKSVHDWTRGELLQLTVRRHSERLQAESAHPDGFISDGSILHEPIYAKCRLVAGSYPTSDDLAAFQRDPVIAAYEDVVDHIGLLSRAHAARAYDIVLHLPVEFPLRDATPPISETFRHLTESLLSEALDAIGVRPHTLSGTVDERVEQALTVIARRPAATPQPSSATVPSTSRAGR